MARNVLMMVCGLLCSSAALATPGMPHKLKFLFNYAGQSVAAELDEIDVGGLVFEQCLPALYNRQYAAVSNQGQAAQMVLGAQAYRLVESVSLEHPEYVGPSLHQVYFKGDEKECHQALRYDLAGISRLVLAFQNIEVPSVYVWLELHLPSKTALLHELRGKSDVIARGNIVSSY